MQLVEKHIIKRSNKNWKQIDNMCYTSKSLYNCALYKINNHYKETSKLLRYNKIDKIMRKEVDQYCQLPNNTSQQILMILDRNFKSFFSALRSWKKDKSKFLACPRPPRYKDKNGRNLLIFTTQQVKIKDNFIHFPKKCDLEPIRTKVNNLQQIRIVPQTGCYVVEVIYKKETVNHDLNENAYIALDLGVNNIIAITSNQPGLKPILINGRILKSINQFFNKKKASMQSQLEKNHKKKTSKKLQSLCLKRSNKIDYILHHISKFVVQYCIENDIKNIIIGHNDFWKQETNMGRTNNQNFICIPYNKFIHQIKYKAELNSIDVAEITENYTSKCSALDKEQICKHDEYIGKRTNRGLFKWSNGLLNADVNGSLNILRKVIGNDFINLVNRGCVDQPVKVQLSQMKEFKDLTNFISF